MVLRQSLTALVATLKRFRAEQRAVAAVEFALTVPLLLLLYVGSTELSEAITVDRHLTTVSGTTGDLVAQAKSTLSRSLLNDYFVASQKIMLPFSSTPLKQVISCISVDANGVTKVLWSEVFNGGTARVVNATYPLPTEMIAISKGSYVIVSEASYIYTPIVGTVFTANIPLYHENFYLPRFGDKITITSP
jgi:Flp pilus assembly protein TadG